MPLLTMLFKLIQYTQRHSDVLFNGFPSKCPVQILFYLTTYNLTSSTVKSSVFPENTEFNVPNNTERDAQRECCFLDDSSLN